MKHWILACVMGVMGINSAWAASEQPSVLIYISPDKYNHPLRIGLLPYYSHWVKQGEVAEKVASKALEKHFSKVGMCEAGLSSDIVVWVKPRLIYNPGVGRYYAMLKVQFHLGDGSPLATYKAVGEQDGNIGSAYVDETIDKAFGVAMENIESLFVNDATLQQAISTAKDKGFPHSPCGMVAVFGRSQKEE